MPLRFMKAEGSATLSERAAAEPLEAAAGSELAGRMARLRRLLPSSTGSAWGGGGRSTLRSTPPCRKEFSHDVQPRPQACRCPALGLRRARPPPRQPQAESSPRHRHRPRQLTADSCLHLRKHSARQRQSTTGK